MMRSPVSVAFVAVAAFLMTSASSAHAAGAGIVPADRIEASVAQTIRPLMTRYGIPGMAVGVTIGGKHYIYNYGFASKATRTAIGNATLFEIGSVTKTFTATLASYAQLSGALSLSDRVSSDFPALRGTSFESIDLYNLGTHTAGGLPLQFPGTVMSDQDALKYYQRWKPSHAAGTYRLYSNTGIMLLGLITARRLGSDFVPLMQRIVLGPLRLTSTFLVLPGSERYRYAEGYTATGSPHHMSPGPLEAEAYGIRTTAADMLRFLDANLGLLAPNRLLSRAIAATHAGYFTVGPMTQDLIWEQYRYPVTKSSLLQGNSEHMIFDGDRVVRIAPPARPRSDVLIDKTGSTGGFGAYVAFIPSRRVGIVLLANKSFPIAARVTAAYDIVSRIGSSQVVRK